MRVYVIDFVDKSKYPEEITVTSTYEPVVGVYGFRYKDREGRPCSVEYPVSQIAEINIREVEN